MQKILIIGAGRSATSLIEYLLEEAKSREWFVTVADFDLDLAKSKIGDTDKGEALSLNIKDDEAREEAISRHDVIISMLPAFMHDIVAKDALKHGKHMVTASYISDEIERMSDGFKAKDAVFMGEMGLDPGIDHMSAMEKINEIKEAGGTINTFRSYTGGIIAEESDDNPWHYKFTWNPRNVVLAGQSTAKYLVDGAYTYAPYRRLFKDAKNVDVKGLGEFEMYPNRDSLDYQTIYTLQNTPNLIRGTLRRPGYCQAWNALIELGLTDDTYKIDDSASLTYAEWVSAYVRHEPGDHVKEQVAAQLGLDIDGQIMQQLSWLDLFSDENIDLEEATPAQILQKLLMQKWTLKPEDKDLIIMQHEFEYEINSEEKTLYSTMHYEGEDSTNTAMSKLVGLPLGIFTKLLLDGEIDLRGVHIPVTKEVYSKVLRELEQFDVHFKEITHTTVS
jgi:saccharopine dehydrogenase (NADP+, L-glutamate forming)